MDGAGLFSARRGPILLAAMPMLALLLLPILGLFFGVTPNEVLEGSRHPLFGSALGLSARTSVVSLAIIFIAGTPLAWWLAVAPSKQTRAVEIVVDLPIILPPAVVGIALLQAFGRGGILGDQFAALGIQLPFTTSAVVLAQVVVAAPFYIQSAAAAFRRVDPDILIVARTLGQSPFSAFIHVAIPVAMPGLIGGAALAWARALGEFGATLLFAGNLAGETQTAPLAIYMALESDVRAAVALALVLAGAAAILLFVFRSLPFAWRQGNRP